MREVGAVAGSAVRKIAVPETRWGGLASSLRTSQLRSASSLRVALLRLLEPRTQVRAMRPMSQAVSSGSHPPSGIFIKLAARKDSSISASGSINDAAFQNGQFQQRQTTKKAMRLSISIVAVTERP